MLPFENDCFIGLFTYNFFLPISSNSQSEAEPGKEGLRHRIVRKIHRGELLLNCKKKKIFLSLSEKYIFLVFTLITNRSRYKFEKGRNVNTQVDVCNKYLILLAVECQTALPYLWNLILLM